MSAEHKKDVQTHKDRVRNRETLAQKQSGRQKIVVGMPGGGGGRRWAGRVEVGERGGIYRLGAGTGRVGSSAAAGNECRETARTADVASE
jgi:hypothetical protein